MKYIISKYDFSCNGVGLCYNKGVKGETQMTKQKIKDTLNERINLLRDQYYENDTKADNYHEEGKFADEEWHREACIMIMARISEIEMMLALLK